MNWDQVKGSWKELKGTAQQEWGKLTEDDLDIVDGRRTELIGKVQSAYGKTRNEAEKEVDAWLARQRLASEA